MKLIIPYVLMIFFALIFATGTVAAQTPICAGWIDAIQGKAYWKQSVNAKPVLLNLKQDKYRRLYAGDCVKVGIGGALKLVLYGRVTNLQGPSGWFPVPLVHTAAQNAGMQILNNYARIGGRERAGSLIYFPATESVVRPEGLIIRWTPQEFRGALTVVLQDNDGNDLWRQSGVIASAGMLDSEALRQALLKYRSDGNRRQLVLAIADPEGNSAQSDFTLLSVQDNQALTQDFVRWNQETGLLRYLGRVDAFATRGMIGDVAQEYELALAEAPDSRDLLQATITAQERIGNTDRVRDLTQRLKSSHQTLKARESGTAK